MWAVRPAKMEVGAMEIIYMRKGVEKIEFFLSADLALLLVMSQSARIGSLVFATSGYRTGGSVRLELCIGHTRSILI